MAGQTDKRDSDSWQMKIPLLTAASQGPEAVAAWGAVVTASADDVRLALTLPTLYLALAAAGALRVALAGCGSRTSMGPGLPCLHLPISAHACPSPAHALPLLPCPPCHGHGHILTHCPRQGSPPAHCRLPTHAVPRRASGLRHCRPGGHRPGPGDEGEPCETPPGTGTAPAPPGALLPLPHGTLATLTPVAGAPTVRREEERGWRT